MGNCCSAKASPVVEPERDCDTGDIVVGKGQVNTQSHKVTPAPNNIVNDGSSLVFYERAPSNVATSSLVSMCKQGKLSVVMELLKKEEVDVNIKGMFDTTPLISACQYNHESIALTLLERKDIDIHHANHKGGVALTYACLEGMRDAVEELLKMGANANTPEVILYNNVTDRNDYLAPLSAAVINGHASIVSSLLGSIKNSEDNMSNIVHNVDQAYQQFSNLNTASTKEKKIIQGVTCLMLACRYTHGDIITLLLKHKANVNLTDSEGSNILHYTCRSKGADDSLSILRDLNILSPNLINAVDSRGDTCLHLSCDAKNVAAVSILLTYLRTDKAQMMIRKDRQSNPTAQSAAISTVVQNLLNKAMKNVITNKIHTKDNHHYQYYMNIHPLYQNMSGTTPLHLAVKRRSVDLVDLLLLHDFDPEIKDNSGVSPRDMAEKLPKSSPILEKINTYLVTRKCLREQSAANATSSYILQQQQWKEKQLCAPPLTPQNLISSPTTRITTPPSNCPLTPIKPAIINKQNLKHLTLTPPPSRQELFSDQRKLKSLQSLEVSVNSTDIIPPTIPDDKTPETDMIVDEDNHSVNEMMLEPLPPEFTTPSKNDGIILSPEYTSGAKLNTAPMYSGSNYKAVTSAPKKQGGSSVSSSSRKFSKSTVLQPPPLCQLSLYSAFELQDA